MPLDPATPAAAAREIKRMNRVPGFLGFLGGLSSAFQPFQIEVRLQAQLLKDGRIPPGGTKKGFLFFIRPATADPSSSYSVVWLETSNRRPQLLETKGVSVWTRPAGNLDLPTRARHLVNWLFADIPPAFNQELCAADWHREYDHLPRLSSPAQDVERMAMYLKQQGFDEIVTIKDESVTKDTLRQPEIYLEIKLGPMTVSLLLFRPRPECARRRPARGYIPLANELADGSQADRSRWTSSCNG